MWEEAAVFTAELRHSFPHYISNSSMRTPNNLKSGGTCDPCPGSALASPSRWACPKHLLVEFSGGRLTRCLFHFARVLCCEGRVFCFVFLLILFIWESPGCQDNKNLISHFYLFLCHALVSWEPVLWDCVTSDQCSVCVAANTDVTSIQEGLDLRGTLRCLPRSLTTESAFHTCKGYWRIMLILSRSASKNTKQMSSDSNCPWVTVQWAGVCFAVSFVPGVRCSLDVVVTDTTEQ